MSDSKMSDWVILKRVFGLAKPYYAHILAILILSILATPIALLTPIPIKIAVDSVIGSKPLPDFLTILIPEYFSESKLGLLLFAAIFQVLIVLLSDLQSLANYSIETVTGEKLTLSFRTKLFQHAKRLSLAFHDSKGTSDSIYRIQYDAPSIQWILVYGFIPFITSSVMFLSMIYVIFIIDSKLALIAIIISPFLIIYARSYNKHMRSKYSHSKKLESSALNIIQEVLTSVRIVKAFGQEAKESDRFADMSEKGMKSRIKLVYFEIGFGLLVNLTIAIGTSLVLYIGVKNVLAGLLSLGDLLLVISYLAMLYGPLRTMSNQTAHLQASLASANRAFELLDELPEVYEKPNAKNINRSSGNIEFENVSYSYDGRNEALSEISFKVENGTKVGLLGHTGAGKTTIINLLMRFYDTDEGQILMDNHNIKEFKLADLRNQFSLVLQEPILLSTTITENIRYGCPEAELSEVVKAAKAANAHDFIMELNHGYDTLVGERGSMLSGGERQRISLARAFIVDSPILILDEPTSSVDIKTESLIIEALEELMKGRTTFIIAHRLSTLEHCDKFLLLDKGKLQIFTDDLSLALDKANFDVGGEPSQTIR